jgi:FKBP-type peptidyl-prolyl cis-trans isomerase
MSSPTQQPKPFGSTKSLRLLGNVIALATLTGLMAYGCEKAQSQKAQTEPTPTQKAEPPKPAAPAPAPTPAPAAADPKPTTPVATTPAPAGPPPTLVVSDEPVKPVETEPAKPETPKLKPIPHEELAKDAKPISEFTTPTNVIVQDFKKGEGFPTLPKAVVTMHFVLRLKDGWKKIQSTWEDGAPETYQLDEVVFGMADGIIGMQAGATRRIIVPPERGFGARGVMGKDGAYVIPPGATLVYDVDLISNKQKVIETPPAKPVTPKFNAGRKDEGGTGK